MAHSYPVGSKTVVLFRGDITRETTDVIANAANAGLLGGGGVDGAIHRAAGPGLMAACRQITKTLPDGLLAPGDAVITPGFGLRARHVVHCVGPVYRAEGAQAPVLLARCYTTALALAAEAGATSIAFPAISTGVYGYPLDEAAAVSLGAVRDYLLSHEAPTLVRFALFGEDALRSFEAAATRLFGPSSAAS